MNDFKNNRFSNSLNNAYSNEEENVIRSNKQLNTNNQIEDIEIDDINDDLNYNFEDENIVSENLIDRNSNERENSNYDNEKEEEEGKEDYYGNKDYTTNQSIDFNKSENEDPIFIMNLELDEGKPIQIHIYSKTDPSQLAREFCEKYNLDNDSYIYLKGEVETLLLNQQNEKFTNNSQITEADEDNILKTEEDNHDIRNRDFREVSQRLEKCNTEINQKDKKYNLNESYENNVLNNSSKSKELKESNEKYEDDCSKQYDDEDQQIVRIVTQDQVQYSYIDKDTMNEEVKENNDINYDNSIKSKDEINYLKTESNNLVNESNESFNNDKVKTVNCQQSIEASFNKENNYNNLDMNYKLSPIKSSKLENEEKTNTITNQNEGCNRVLTTIKPNSTINRNHSNDFLMNTNNSNNLNKQSTNNYKTQDHQNIVEEDQSNSIRMGRSASTKYLFNTVNNGQKVNVFDRLFTESVKKRKIPKRFELQHNKLIICPSEMDIVSSNRNPNINYGEILYQRSKMERDKKLQLQILKKREIEEKNEIYNFSPSINETTRKILKDKNYNSSNLYDYKGYFQHKENLARISSPKIKDNYSFKPSLNDEFNEKIIDRNNCNTNINNNKNNISNKNFKVLIKSKAEAAKTFTFQPKTNAHTHSIGGTFLQRQNLFKEKLDLKKQR